MPNKGMANIYWWEKLTFLKKTWRNVLALKSQKVQGIFSETCILS